MKRKKVKIDRLRDKKDELLKSCNICNHTGYLIKQEEKYNCKCMKKFGFYVQMYFSGIEPEYWDLDINNWEGDQKAKDDILSYMSNVNGVLKHGLSLGFGGSHGVGKTFAMNLILKEMLKIGYSCCFVTLNELLNDIKSSFDGNQDEKDILKNKIYNIKTSHFLGLDDLGGEYVPSDFGKFTASKCDLIFRERRRNCLPTIITTNLKRKEFLEYYGSALNSILSSRFKFIWISGKDFRIFQGKEWEKLLRRNNGI